ncbi:ThiF family adenylyltransferase [Cupriavidus pauculus]|uniref:ThiF family adenylyltransferase n=1 Tax=Cupriavidus pauculus TaxID=82633 RepID=UPI001FD54D75|nr:ThiF family adenylyltransferase [Cupriavidus pauculus]
MNRGHTLALPGVLHARLKEHLIVKDGLEAVAILLCTRVNERRVKFLAKDVILVPYGACDRREDFISWPGDYLIEATDRAEKEDLTIFLVHSHPGGYYAFSDADDRSDRTVVPTLHVGARNVVGKPAYHGSAIMTPSGALKARVYDVTMCSSDVELVAVYGDELKFYWNDGAGTRTETLRPMALGKAMTAELGKLSACVIGASGTGSLVAEQLARMGFGELILVDDDRVEIKNLNRIVNSSSLDAAQASLKVEMLKRAIASYRSDCEVIAVDAKIGTLHALKEAAVADIVFCCVDSEEGRLMCDRLASACVMPLFDVGVVAPVRTLPNGVQAIVEIAGRVDYVQPGGSTLGARGIYTPQSLLAEYLQQHNPEAFQEQVAAKYLPGSQEQAPAIISVNMLAASTCVAEFIARAYPFRLDPSRQRAQVQFMLSGGETLTAAEESWKAKPCEWLATGLTSTPLFGLPAITI